MLEHHVQRAIVYRLAFAEGLRFSELKPDDIENKLFTYHLKKVMDAGYVIKRPDGSYALTADGRRVGINVMDKLAALESAPLAVLFLAVRRQDDGAWLLYRRRTHPLFGKAGFMHANPVELEDSLHVARKTLLAKTGLVGTFQALGSGFFRVYENGQLESFTNFTLLICEDAAGELQAGDDLAEYYWETSPDFTAPDMLPNMQLLSDLYVKGEPFFVEETFHV